MNPTPESYKLSVKDCTNPTFNKKQYYSLDELRKGDLSGMTETDSKTSGKEDGPYTSINKKSGPGGRPWKSSAKRAAM